MLHKTSGSESAKKLHTSLESIRDKNDTSLDEFVKNIGISRTTYKNLNNGLATEKTISKVSTFLRGLACSTSYKK